MMRNCLMLVFVLCLLVGCGGGPKAGDTRVRETDGMLMVYVPAGEFLMGSTDAEVEAAMAQCADCSREWFAHERPQHKVYLDSFWIDRTEVTNAQYRRCVEAGACDAPQSCGPAEPPFDQASMAGHPVVCVSWSDAIAYCTWAGGRLPTEAEWEKAAAWDARGGKRVYPWGDAFDGTKVNFCDRNCEYDDWKDASVDDGFGSTAPVGSYPAGASPYGALDMGGNVWEWVADWYGEDYYASSADRNPQGPDSGEYRELRGGSWGAERWGVRTALRTIGASPDYRHNGYGFRCVLPATSNPQSRS